MKLWKLTSEQFLSGSMKKAKKKGTSELIQALLDEKPDGFQKSVNHWLRKSISYHDENESFYHDS